MEKKELVENLLACDLFIRDINQSLNGLRTLIFVNDQLSKDQLEKNIDNKKQNIITDLNKIKSILETSINIKNKG